MSATTRVVSLYSQHRTGTGRLASGLDTTEPDKKGRRVQQLQNIPKSLRTIFAAEEGYTLVGGDFAAIEWAIAVYFASLLDHPRGFHKDMLQRFRHGKFDPHVHLASHAYDVAYDRVTKEMRQTCKVYTHGYTFDGAPTTLARNAGHKDEVGIRVCRAHDIAFRMRAWKDYTVNEAARKGYVQTPLGWRRYFLSLEPDRPEILATLVQGTAADLCKTKLKALYDTCLVNEWELLTSTHDSYLIQVPRDDRHVALAIMTDILEGPVSWLGGNSFRADVSFGTNWREVS